jgi:hypothetical protein
MIRPTFITSESIHPPLAHQEKYETNYLSNQHQKLSLLTKTEKRLYKGIKRKRRLDATTRKRLEKDENDIIDANIENWLCLTGRFPDSEWKIKERRNLKSWFDSLDRDGSGEIDIDELLDPLLSTGLAKTVSEVKTLVRRVDEDNSGAIGFKEFLSIMKKDSKRSKNGIETKVRSNELGLPSKNRSHQRREFKKTKSDQWLKITNEAKSKSQSKSLNRRKVSNYTRTNGNSNPIAQLQMIQKDIGLGINSILAIKRRNLLLDATMGEAERRELAIETIGRWRIEMKQMKGVPKFRKLHDISKLSQKLETDQVEKENFVNAMKPMISKRLEMEAAALKNANNRGSRHYTRGSPLLKQKRSGMRNFLMLTKDADRVGLGGGRHALLYPRTRNPSLPTLLGIPRSH